MKKRTSKLLALFIGLSMLPLTGMLHISATAEETAARLTPIIGYNGQDGKLPAVTNGTAVIEGNIPGKTEEDKGIKLSIGSEKTFAYADLSIFDSSESTVAISERTVTFEVYPGDAITSIQIKGRATKHPNYEISLSEDIPASVLNDGQWNKVMFLYNPNGANSIYINNVFYANSTAHFTAPSTSSKLTYANVRLYAKTEATDGTAFIYLDNIYTAKGAAVMPAAKSGKYIIDSQIQEYDKNTTVKDVLDNITYTGTSIAVNNARGEDITESPDTVIAKDDTVHVYDGEIETGLYRFGEEHKPLAALYDNAGIIMSSGFEEDAHNFSLQDAAAAMEAGTEYDKPANDNVLKISGNADKASYFAYRTTKPADRTKVSTISFEVYPNGTWTRLDISTNGGMYFLRLPSDRLKKNEWNQITLIVGGDDKTLRPNSVYVNGKEVTGETANITEAGKIYVHTSLLMGNTAASGQQLRIGVSGVTEGVQSSLVIDNFYQAEGQALIPSLSSHAYNIDGMAIREYKRDTVEDVVSDITYNGSKAVLTDNNGTVIEDNTATIGIGNHLYIYDGDFITGHYVFKEAHKAPVIVKSYIDNFDGITVADGTCQTESGVHGKSSSDTSLKLVGSADKKTVYLNESIFDTATKSIPASTITFEVYPNDTIDEIVIAGRPSKPNSEISFQKIPVLDLAANQWNKILFEYNVTGENKIYINGKLYSSSDSGHFVEATAALGHIRIKANYTPKDGVTPYVYIDDVQMAHGKTMQPAMETKAYGIDGNMINGCLDTAANVKANITAAFGLEAKIKNSSGTELEYNDTVAVGDSIYVYDGDFIAAHYYVEEGKFIVSSPVIDYSGFNAGDTVTASLTYSDAGKIPNQFTVYLAVYDKNNRITDAEIKPVKTTGNDAVTTVKTDVITMTDRAYKIKAFVFDKELISLAGHDSVESPDIICWGDSLTFGTGTTNRASKSYPSQLALLTGKNVENMGVYSETAMTIAARMGAYDIVTSEEVVIPKDKAVSFGVTSTGGAVAPCGVNFGGWNDCTIGGISGKITADIYGDTPPKMLNSITFTRSEAGEKTVIPKGTRLISDAQKTSAEWNVIFVGTNGGWSADNLSAAEHAANGDEAKLVSLVEKMVNRAPYKEKCIIIGLTAGSDVFDKANTALKEKFGNRFIDAKEYFTSKQALADAGITLTEADLQMIADKKVPPSLLAADDELHFNDKGYELMAQLVYNKLIELGFEI